MNQIQRDILLKSWSNINEIALIKDVATKGENIELCQEYLAKRKNITSDASLSYFNHIVDNYVNDLLNEKLVYKAEMVLKNLKRDVKSIYYQFAFECHHNQKLQTIIFEYLRKPFQLSATTNQNDDWLLEIDNYKFYWKSLKEIQFNDKLNGFVKNDMKSLTIENFLQKDQNYQNIVLLQLYYETNNNKILDKLNSICIWKYFIQQNNYTELIVWCNLQIKFKTDIEITTDLMRKYSNDWEISDDMLKMAVENLKNSPDVLRDLFMCRGFVFPDEIHNIQLILNRIFRTQSLQPNEKLIKTLPIANYLMENELYSILLEDFVTFEDIEVLKTIFIEKIELLNLIVVLKTKNLTSSENFVKLSQASTEFLLKNCNKYTEPEAIVKLGNFILTSNDFNDLDLNVDFVKELPFISSLLQKINGHNFEPGITVNSLMKEHLNIDLIELSKELGNEPASFTNSTLRKKYSKDYKLNFLHYLKQQRSSFAIYCFFSEQLVNYSQISRSQLFGSVETVTDLAIQNYQNSDLFGHCICFIEMLGFDTQNVRSLVHLIQNYCENIEILDYHEIIRSSEQKIFHSDFLNSKEEFPLKEYESLMRIAKIYSNKCWPKIYFKMLASKNDWWKLLILFQYFETPTDEIKKISTYFDIPIIGEHFVRALTHEHYTHNGNELLNSSSDKSYRKSSFSRQRSTTRTENNSTISGDTMTSSLSSNNATDSYNILKSNQQIKCLPDSDDFDLFALIILSTSNILHERITTFAKFMEIILDNNSSYSTSLNLMRNCLKHRQPILAVLSSTISDLNHDWNWLIWLIVSTDNCHLIKLPGINCNDITFKIIEICVKQGKIRILHKSFSIFLKDNQFIHFTKFLLETISLNFIDINLRLYFLALSNEEVYLPLVPPSTTRSHKDQIMLFTIKLIILNLKYNFSSANYQQDYLNLLSNSGLSDIYSQIDFTLLRNIFAIILPNNHNFEFELLLIETKNNNQQVYEDLLSDLNKSKDYDRAIQLAEILNKSACDIIYEKWINQLNLSSEGKFNFSKYELETDEHSLPPEFLVNFYLYVAEQYTEYSPQKYSMFKAALNVIKRNHLFANESFDRDLIEYEMILCFLQNDKTIHEIEIYHSEYFEEILSKERCVLYKSFSEIKDLAGIEDLTASLKIKLTDPMKSKLNDLLDQLLDDGDIVEALRIQAMFEHPTVDLRYLVFCMALAEGLTTIYSLSHEERMVFVNAEKSLFATKFEKRTLDKTPRPNPTMQVQSRHNDDNSDSNSTLGFEEIPAKEKQKVLDALQGFASNLKYGLNLGKRIVMVYRAAMYLDKDYSDVFRTKDVMLLLDSATKWDCLKKLLVVNDIFISSQMTPIEISEYLGHEIATAIIRPLFYILTADQDNINYHQAEKSMLWGYDLDREFHLFLELCPKTTLLGKCLLDYCDQLRVYRQYQDNQPYQNSECFEKLEQIIKKHGLPTRNKRNARPVLSHKKQNTIYLELLIKAHECFVHECSMEGIADVLNRAKILNTILANAKSWKLIARMLTGIGRYREMFYCFNTLIQNDQFEFLLGQFDAEKIKGLRYATISYLRDSCAQNQEYLKLVALHFLMFKELAEMWDENADLNISKMLNTYRVIENDYSVSQSEFKKFSVSKLHCNLDVQNILNEVLECLTQSSENYLLDNKLRLAQQTAAKAELVALQIDLVNKVVDNSETPFRNQLCICVLNIESREEFQNLIISELKVPQTLILGAAHSYDINWAEVLLWQFVILDRPHYLQEFLKCMDLTDIIIENIVKGFQLHTHTFPRLTKMESNLEVLVKMVASVTAKYRLASLMSFKNIITTMLNDESLYYLKDTNYGRNDVSATED